MYSMVLYYSRRALIKAKAPFEADPDTQHGLAIG